MFDEVNVFHQNNIFILFNDEIIRRLEADI